MTFEKYIEGMSTRDLVAQLLCPALRATYKEDSDPREYFENVFKDCDVKPGAYYMFPSKKEDITNLTKMLKERGGNYPLFATDMETSPSFIQGASNFGHGDWLKGGTDACHPMPKASKIMAEYIYNEFKVL